jgi:hypothetical protein
MHWEKSLPWKRPIKKWQHAHAAIFSFQVYRVELIRRGGLIRLR